MAVSFPMMRSEDGLVAVVAGGSYSVRKDHSKYGLLIKAIKEGDEKTFLENVSEEKVIQTYLSNSQTLNGKVTLEDGVVLYEGKPVHNTLTQRIIEFKNEGLPFEPMLHFMEKLFLNPSSKAVNELYDFLENKNLPITPDGDFLAYKMVNDNYWSKTAGSLKLLKGKVDESGYIYNGIGEEIECRRNEVDDNRDNECSYGLHVGGLAYSGPGGSFGSGKSIIVKVNPADVIAVPKDYNAQKARVCHYTVVEDYVAPLNSTLSTSQSEYVEPVYGNYDSYINEYDDEEEEEEEDYDDDAADYEDEEEDEEEDEYDDDDEEKELKFSKSIRVEQVRDGDYVEFIYTTTKENRKRFVIVESATGTNIYGRLSPDDPKYVAGEENYRNFIKKHISDVVLWS
jgi:hypothetical protein